MKKNNWGGKRKGSGKKLIYGEPTIQSAFRFPKSKAKEIRKKVNEILKEYRKP